MKTEQIIGVTLATCAFILLMLAHFLPTHTFSGNGVSYETTIWGMEGETSMSLPGMGFQQSFSQDWSNSDADDMDGIEKLRAAGPLLIVATVMAFAAIAAGLTAPRNSLLPFVFMATGAIFVILSLVLYQSGISESNDQMSYTYGFGIIVAAIATSALATVLLALPATTNGRTIAE